MSFDPTRLQPADPSAALPLGRSRDFGSMAEALQAANSDKGDELIVEYEDEQAQSVRFAVVDVRGGRDLDLSNLPNSDDLKIRSVLRTREETRDVGGQRTTLNFIGGVSFPDRSLDHNIASTLALAHAAYDRIPVGRRGTRELAAGFRHQGQSGDWDEQVTANKTTLLTRLNDTSTTVARRLSELDTQIDLAARKSPPGDDGPLVAERTRLRSQASQLRTYQELLIADLATSTHSRAAIPGVQSETGQPRLIGDARNTFDVAIRRLEVYRAALNPGSQRSEIELVQARIDGLHTRQQGVAEAALHSAKRMLALARMGQGIAEAQRHLADLEPRLRELEASDAGMALDGHEGNELRQLRQEVYDTVGTLLQGFDRQIADYGRHSSGRGTAARAIAFLRSQVRELETLAEAVRPDAPADGRQRASAVIDLLNTTQSHLLSLVTQGAGHFDGVDPREVDLFGAIGRGVDRFDGEIQQARDRIDSLQAQVDDLRRVRGQGYRGPLADTLRWIEGARNWTATNGATDPFEVNQAIVGWYQDFGADLAAEIGDPGLVTWGTVAAHACNGAGEQIATLMDFAAALHRLDSWNPATKLRAKAQLNDLMSDPQRREQLLAVVEAFEPHLAGLLRDQLDDDGEISLAEAARLRVFDMGAIEHVAAAADQMRAAFIEGNTRIAGNVLDGWRLFKQAGGGDRGLQALKQNVANGRLQDPQGFLVQAFERYDQARRLGVQLQRMGADDPRRAELTGRIRCLVDEGNLLIGWQEQSTFLQTRTTFGDPQVAQALEAVSGHNSGLRLPGAAAGEPGETFQLARHWQILHERMGADILTGPSAQQAYADSLSPPQWQAENERRAATGRPALPPQTVGAHDDGNLYVSMRISDDQVIHDASGTPIRPHTPAEREVVFRVPREHPPAGTVAAMFLDVNRPDSQLAARVRQAPVFVASPTRLVDHTDRDEAYLQHAGEASAEMQQIEQEMVAAEENPYGASEMPPADALGTMATPGP